MPKSLSGYCRTQCRGSIKAPLPGPGGCGRWPTPARHPTRGARAHVSRPLRRHVGSQQASSSARHGWRNALLQIFNPEPSRPPSRLWSLPPLQEASSLIAVLGLEGPRPGIQHSSPTYSRSPPPPSPSHPGITFWFSPHRHLCRPLLLPAPAAPLAQLGHRPNTACPPCSPCRNTPTPTRRNRPRLPQDTTPTTTAPAAPSAAPPTRTRTGPRSRISPSAGGYRTASPSATTVGGPPRDEMGNPGVRGMVAKRVGNRQEAQEAPGGARAARRNVR